MGRVPLKHRRGATSEVQSAAQLHSKQKELNRWGQNCPLQHCIKKGLYDFGRETSRTLAYIHKGQTELGPTTTITHRGRTAPYNIALRRDCITPVEKPPEPWPMSTKGQTELITHRGRTTPYNIALKRDCITPVEKPPEPWPMSTRAKLNL